VVLNKQQITVEEVYPDILKIANF